MLEYDRTYVSEGIDVNKTNASKEWYLLDKSFKFETYVCNCCHDLMQ